MKNKSIYVNQTSLNVEWGSPLNIINLARLTMGSIDLDPASSLVANERVKATNIFTLKDKGLNQKWYGNVWMNHPFGNRELKCKAKCVKKKCNDRGYCIDYDIPGNSDWINKLVQSYLLGDINQACCITFAATSEHWFKPLKAYPLVMIDKRTNFIDLHTGKEIKGVTKGCVVTYLGNNIISFYENFKTIGDVFIPVGHNYGFFTRG